MKNLIFSFVVIVLMHSMLSAQENTVADSLKVYQFETLDGNVFTGTIVTENDQAVQLKTEKLGVIRLAKSDIRSTKLLENVVEKGGKIWTRNPQSTRYFWAPNGYGLGKGEAYYQNIWIFYNQISVGLTNNFSLSGGMVPLFLFDGASTPIWVVPKFSIPVVKDKFNIGTGAFLGTVIGEDSGVFGLLFGTATFGSRDKNLSLGVAQGFSNNGSMDFPVFNADAMIRIGPRGYFITENYLVADNGTTVVVLSAGGRSMIKNVGLDYSLWIPVSADMGGFFAIPFLGITVPLGKNNRNN